MDYKHNPNCHECLRRDTSHSWSDLPLDLVISVFERLSFANFQRAKSVCSSWHSASRQSVPKNQIPWLIFCPKYDFDNDNDTSCTLFNPEEKHKLYRTQDLDWEFGQSSRMATCGSWLLLLRDPHLYPQCIIYVLNLFTHERFDLPPVESVWKDYVLSVARFKRMRYRGIKVRSPVFWIDEKTKDYIVLWGLRDWCVVSSKKGDTSWNQIPNTSDCFDMVYKDHKLYFLSCFDGIFRIFDFSGETPRRILESCVCVESFQIGRPLREPSDSWSIWATQLVVNVTGEILIVETWCRASDKTWSVRVFKVYSSGVIKKPERIHSLGDESMLLDQGITVLANDADGFTRNSIYCGCKHGKSTNGIFIFNLETQETDPLLHSLFSTSPIQFSRAQWFLPSFTHTGC